MRPFDIVSFAKGTCQSPGTWTRPDHLCHIPHCGDIKRMDVIRDIANRFGCFFNCTVPDTNTFLASISRRSPGTAESPVPHQ